MRPTREGYRYLLATSLIGLAAVNTGNNLIYLIFGMLLSVLLLSYLLIRVNLWGLSLKVEAGHPVFAGQETLFRMIIQNSKRRVGSYSLRVHLPQGLLAGESSGYFPYIRPGSSESSEAKVTFRRRGRFHYGDFRVETSFPFIFFRRFVVLPVEGDVLVYPKLRELDLDSLRRGFSGDLVTSRPGRSDDLLMIREFRDGDDVKHINWKATARMEGLMVREFTEHQPRTVTIVLDNSEPPDEFAFERGVSFAASVAWMLGLEGYYVRLVMCGGVVPFGTGLAHVYRVLDELAVSCDGSREGCPEVEEAEGMNVLILKSEGSPLASLAAGGPTVVVHAASAL
jgi:uncharacterized protein (DUF58 family)